ncbi:MAG TPA: hypothetical protein ENN29_09835 [Candidatus Hydrogenedentes bacterium]|nr:hypothetical protein [Candidatus Hydrogenedentota bacterium]
MRRKNNRLIPETGNWSGLTTLGTDGFGRSAARAELRDFFEVDHRFIALAALTALAQRNELSADVVIKAMEAMRIYADKPNPISS